MKGLICLKELMLTKPKSHIGVCNDYYFLKVILDFNQKYAMIAMISCKRLWVLMMFQFIRLNEMIIEFIFVMWVKMKPLIY